MAVGQQVLVGRRDVPALRAAEDRLEARAVDAGRVHAALLRDVLAVHAQYCAAGTPLSSQPQIALLLRCSDRRAGKLLNDALGLAELPEAMAALEWGLLTVEQSSVVVALLAVLDVSGRLRVWQRLMVRLRRDVEQGGGLPPARLTELLRRWVVEADQDAARERREQAERDRRVDYRRRDDGLVDLFLIGLKPTDAQSVLQRIRAESEPVGLWDDRTADQRRLDAAVDLLLGRTGSRCGSSCGCLPGTPAPCGAEVAVLVPLATALGTGDDPAELVGHGPIDDALLQDLLANRPRLRPVVIDEQGVPVAVGGTVLTPERGDPVALRQALLRLVEMTPPGRYPRHPHDHPPDEEGREGGGDPPAEPAADHGPPGDPGPRDDDHDPAPEGAASGWRPDEQVLAAAALGSAALGGKHPAGRSGGYRVARRLRRLIELRAPRCEFPGCGARAVRCDAEHDVAWPDGPTCSCNLGPCCRRHHRVKQEGWTKTRSLEGVRWASRTGRTWLSRQQHSVPTPAKRALTTPWTSSEWDELNPADLAELLWILDGRPDDPAGWELRAQDVEPVDEDRTQEQLLTTDTRWTYDLSNPWNWVNSS